MSEQLSNTSTRSLGKLTYYGLGATTLGQLKKAGVITGPIPKELILKKPDALLTLGNGSIKAVIEFKLPSELKTKKQVQSAIQQELAVANHLCSILIVSDGQKTFWINSKSGNPILNEDNAPIQLKFIAKDIESGTITPETCLMIEEVIEKSDHSLTDSNDKLQAPSVTDPSKLARAIWQKIWINTGKEPEKCLYNVVELFVFKFLSDVGVLKSVNNFQSIMNVKKIDGNETALAQYANGSRKEIRKLFPAGDDGTTIINGTIFVNEKGEPNSSQARLFGEVLDSLSAYEREFGSFKYIHRDFKTRLYESFLRQSAGVKLMGQYFTPRNVVQAIVQMSSVDQLGDGARVCDPFCGVGGFILEAIVESPNLFSKFEPINGIINPTISLTGYDKGSDEKDDERTIILAKANMLIYFSDLLTKYNSPSHLKEFSSKVFNSVFHLQRSNLGTFEKIDDEPYDLILTNPPYVTSGSRSLKEAIEDAGLSQFYTSGGRGTEALAIEWIVRALKKGGQAYLVVPDGLLNQEVVLRYLTEHCIIQAIVSLPTRTFYSTPKKTYILSIRKKRLSETQSTPVFTYLVSEIGETRDSNRWESSKNDLGEMVNLFNQYKGSPIGFKSDNKRCKILDWSDINSRSHWMVDRYWNKEEKVSLGIIEEDVEVSEEEFFSIVSHASETLEKFTALKVEKKESVAVANSFAEIQLDNEEFFSLSIGNRLLKKAMSDEGDPVYSANVKVPFGFTDLEYDLDFSTPSLLWGIDGNFEWNLIPKDTSFYPTDHCGVLKVLSGNIDIDYLLYFLMATKDQHGFDRTHRASLKNISKVVVKIPINNDGKFDTEKQKYLAEKFKSIEQIKIEANDLLDKITSSNVVF